MTTHYNATSGYIVLPYLWCGLTLSAQCIRPSMHPRSARNLTQSLRGLD